MLKRFYFLFFGCINLSALLVQFFSSSNVANFFSYFTILSNIFVTGCFLYIGLNKKRRFTQTVDFFFGASVLYMVITGVVFWLLLRDYPNLTTFPWINTMLHEVMPIATFVGWFIYAPHHMLKYRNAFCWLLFPILYLFYSLIRGSFIEWYPYPFLNPETGNGYIGVFTFSVTLTFLAFVLGLVLIVSANTREKNSRRTNFAIRQRSVNN